MSADRLPKAGRRFRQLASAVFLVCCLLAAAASAAGADDLPRTKHNRRALAAVGRELREHRDDDRYCAVLRGLRWCVIRNDDPSRFEASFAGYLIMLDELSRPPAPRGLRRIAHGLIRREFARALPGLGRIFAADPEGYREFISVLPAGYRHRVPLQGLRRFSRAHFAGVAVPDRLGEFRRAAGSRDYAALTDIIVAAAFVDMAYGFGADRDFRLPPNRYRTIMEECARIPFLHRYGEDGYYDQNYYATHIVLALNHFGGRPPAASAAGDHALSYLSANYDAVRNRLEDTDLLCEYLYCLRLFGGGGTLVAEGERHVLSLQRPDGSWGAHEDPADRPPRSMHPTWTAVTLLVLGTGG